MLAKAIFRTIFTFLFCRNIAFSPDKNWGEGQNISG